MNASDGTGRTKIAAAKEALVSLVDRLPDDSLVGLRVYGHRIPNTDKQRGCKDTELIVPVGPLDRAGMKARIRSYDAKGFTPIGLSLREGARDLPTEGKRTIVLVSDGIDTCAPPDPCEVARDIARQGIETRIEAIGFQVDPRARRELQCIARVTGGSYFDARSSGELAAKLSAVSVRALRRYEAAGVPIEGGATIDEALPVEPGQYIDSLSATEPQRWYAVEVATGQELSFSATIVDQRDELRNSVSSFFVQIFDPAGEEIHRAYNHDTTYLDPGFQSLDASSGVVGSDAAFGRLEPGTYFATAWLEADTERVVTGPFPLELTVAVEGDALETAPPPPEDDEGAPPAGPAATDTDASELSLAMLIGAIAMAALGATAGVVLVDRVWR